MSIQNLIEKFIENWLEFDEKLKNKDGIDYEKLKVIEITLIELKDKLSSSNALPKNLVEVFIDIYIVLLRIMHIYMRNQLDKKF